MSIPKLFFSTQGRIPRLTYWLYILGYLGTLFVAFLIDVSLYNEEAGGAFLSLILLLISFFPGLFIAIKRCHDLNHSGWYLLWGIIPIASFFLAIQLIFFEGTEGDNYYGADPYMKENIASDTKKCSYCAEIIKREAVVCRYCGKDQPALPENQDVSSGDTQAETSSRGALDKFIQIMDSTKLEKTAKEYLKRGIDFSDKLEFDDAILEFVKVIGVSTPEDEVYQTAKKQLEGMGFSESDIRHITK